jgi:hypothetical protein
MRQVQLTGVMLVVMTDRQTVVRTNTETLYLDYQSGDDEL